MPVRVACWSATPCCHSCNQDRQHRVPFIPIILITLCSVLSAVIETTPVASVIQSDSEACFPTPQIVKPGKSPLRYGHEHPPTHTHTHGSDKFSYCTHRLLFFTAPEGTSAIWLTKCDSCPYSSVLWRFICLRGREQMKGGEGQEWGGGKKWGGKRGIKETPWLQQSGLTWKLPNEQQTDNYWLK